MIWRWSKIIDHTRYICIVYRVVLRVKILASSTETWLLSLWGVVFSLGKREMRGQHYHIVWIIAAYDVMPTDKNTVIRVWIFFHKNRGICCDGDVTPGIQNVVLKFQRLRNAFQNTIRKTTTTTINPTNESKYSRNTKKHVNKLTVRMQQSLRISDRSTSKSLRSNQNKQ